MACSVDGKTITDRWKPTKSVPDGMMEDVYQTVGDGSWLVGRVAGQEYARLERYSIKDAPSHPRCAWLTNTSASAYAIVLDPHGRIAWGRNEIDGDHLVVVLTESVSDAHLQGLRDDGISYVFAGEKELNLELALRALHTELDIETVLLRGGGTTNGEFLKARLIDELSMLVFPAIDGSSASTNLFQTPSPTLSSADCVSKLYLNAAETLPGDVVWLRYAVLYR